MPLLLVSVVLLGSMLRVFQIDRESLWLDETLSYWIASDSPSAIIRIGLVTKDQTPLYYLSLHYWMTIFGDSDRTMRLFSAVLGISAIPVVFQIGKLLFNARFGLLAAVFLAVSGFHIQYSQEARPYALYFLLTASSLLFAVLTVRGSKHAWVGLALSTALLLYAHNTAIFAAAAVMTSGLVLSWPWTATSLRRIVGAGAGAILLYAPWVPVYARQGMGVLQEYWTSGLTLAPGYISKTLWRLIGSPIPIDGLGDTQYLLIGVPLSLLLLTVPALWAKEKKTLVALALLFLVPVVIHLAVSATLRHIFLPRSLIPALLPFPLLCALPILVARQEPLLPYRALALVAMTTMFLISLGGSMHFLVRHTKEPWRAVTSIFLTNYRHGDGVIYLMHNRRPFMRYLPASLHGVPAVTISATPFDRLPGPRPLNIQDEDQTPTETLQALRLRAARLWMVSRAAPTKPRDSAIVDAAVDWLEASCTKVKEWKLKNLRLVLYEPL